MYLERDDDSRKSHPALAQAPLKWMMDKALLNGLAFRRDVEFDVLPTPPPISDSYGEFMHGAYKLLTLGEEFYREIGPDPVPSSATELRENINETIDASVFEHGARMRVIGRGIWSAGRSGITLVSIG